MSNLPISAKVLPLPDVALNRALAAFLCDGRDVYFVHPRAYIKHLTHAAHAQAPAAAIDQLSEFNLKDVMPADHSRLLVLGGPPSTARSLRRRLMVNFTVSYSHAPSSVNLDATTTTIAELTEIFQSAYGQRDRDQIDWASIWHQGLVFLYSTNEEATGRMMVYNDVDLLELVGKMHFGEHSIGDERRN